jgi:hypothetical protein
MFDLPQGLPANEKPDEVKAYEIASALNVPKLEQILTQEEINEKLGIIEDDNFVPPKDKVDKGLYFEGNDLVFWKEVSGYKKGFIDNDSFWFPYNKLEQKKVINIIKDGKFNADLKLGETKKLLDILADYCLSDDNENKSQFQTVTELGEIARDYGIETKGSIFNLPSNYVVFNSGEKPVVDFVGLENDPKILVETAWSNFGGNYKPPEAYSRLKPDRITLTELDNGKVVEAKWYTLKNENINLSILAEMSLINYSQ